MKRAALVVLLLACNKPSGAPAPAASSAPAPRASAPAPAPDGGTHERAAKIEATVRAWNAAINAHDAEKLGALYADEIELYGRRVSRAHAIAAKRAAFPAHAHDDVTGVSVSESGRATFHKKSALKNGKVIDVLGYLDVDAAGKITSEGDTTTDTNLARKGQVSCEDAVVALVNATAEAKKASAAIPNLAGMVMPPDKPGDGWDVGICENHPDRMPCFHHFTVDPATAKVTYTGLDSVDDITLPTDPSLAAKVRDACK